MLMRGATTSVRAFSVQGGAILVHLTFNMQDGATTSGIFSLDNNFFSNLKRTGFIMIIMKHGVYVQQPMTTSQSIIAIRIRVIII